MCAYTLPGVTAPTTLAAAPLNASNKRFVKTPPGVPSVFLESVLFSSRRRENGHVRHKLTHFCERWPLTYDPTVTAIQNDHLVRSGRIRSQDHHFVKRQPIISCLVISGAKVAPSVFDVAMT
jgi:hypothetical protein